MAKNRAFELSMKCRGDREGVAGDHKGQCHSNKENLWTGFNAMKWADKIFPSFGLVRKAKRHILVSLDEKAGTGGFDDARITPHAALLRQQAVALAQVLQHAWLPL